MKQAGGKTAELVFKSNGEVLDNDYDLKNGNNPYFQWGRKDPMLPGDGITAGDDLGDGKDKTCFTTDANYKFKYGSEGLNTSDIKEYIRNPHKYNIKYEMDGQYYNLWSTDNDRIVPNDELVIKSVYDPSPVGYSLPASNAFTGFTTTGGNTSNPVEWNVKGGFNKGYYFYTKPGKEGNTLYFPAAGYRNMTYLGGIFYVATVGFYWSAIPYSSTQGLRLLFGTNGINPIHNLGRSWAFPVRSAEEKCVGMVKIPD